MIPTLTVDDLQFEVRWSDQRKTLGLTVDREGELLISAPLGCDVATLESFVREKRFWLYTKLAEKDALREASTKKQFVTGEGFPYLGRSYRLLLVDDPRRPLKLERGRFRLDRSVSAVGRRTFIEWYTAHANRWLKPRVGDLASRVGVSPSGIAVRDLGFRWGSCTREGILNFHWATILLPSPIVEYIVVHELAHLRHPTHTPEFWLAVERVMPDFATRRQRLSALGSQLTSPWLARS